MVNVSRTRQPSPGTGPASWCRPCLLRDAARLPPRAREGPSPGSETWGALHTVARSWRELSRGMALRPGGIRGLAEAAHLRTLPFPTPHSYHGRLAPHPLQHQRQGRQAPRAQSARASGQSLQSALSSEADNQGGFRGGQRGRPGMARTERVCSFTLALFLKLLQVAEQSRVGVQRPRL